MQMVPTTLVRITRYYMLAAVGYLLLTLAVGIYRALAPLPNPMLHWAPAVLGWVSFPVMGAFYQFFPTLQGRDLHWERLTMPQFALANAGVLILFVAALTGRDEVFALGATVYVAGAYLFGAIILVANVEQAKLNLTLRFYLVSLGYFLIAMAIFWLQTVGAGPAWASRGLVLHLIVLGWAVMAIFGAEYSMVPMLQLKELRHPRLAEAQFYVANAGVIGMVLGLATSQLPLVAASGALVLASTLLFAYNIVASLRHGPARLPRLDISVKYFVAGIAYLVATALSGFEMAFHGWWSLLPIHIHLGLIGAVTLTIVGAMYHIVPFVVYWEVYAPRLGYEDVPLLKQLFNERSAEWQFYGFNLGLLAMLAGFASQTSWILAAGGSILLASALAFAWEMAGVVRHRRNIRRPDAPAAHDRKQGVAA